MGMQCSIHDPEEGCNGEGLPVSLQFDRSGQNLLAACAEGVLQVHSASELLRRKFSPTSFVRDK